jgi:hypothetical protein
MKTMAKLFACIAALGCVVAATLFWRSNRSSRANTLFISCQNHRGVLAMEVRWYQHEHNDELPYEVGVPGHAMLAKFAAGKTGALNCNHAAPDSRFGGWQAVNLPPEKWKELHQHWAVGTDDPPIPFFWCGKPNKLDKRVLVSVIRYGGGATSEGWSLDHQIVTEKQLRELIARLNRVLVGIKEPSVECDVIANIDWNAYTQKR